MDITTISSAYSAVKAIKELGGSLLDAKIDAESKKRVNELLDKLGGIQDTLFYIREELLKVQDENHTLKEKIKELEAKIEEKGKLQYIKPAYWVVDGDANDGPFCQRCYDDENKLIRLQGGNNDVWSCRKCKNTFYGPNYKTPQIRQPRGSSWV